MKRSNSSVESRRRHIYELLLQQGRVEVDALSLLLDVSPLTIRRDLEYLEKHNLLERYYGGARLPSRSSENFYSSILELHKHAIAKRAAELIQDGDSVFINTSSTALLILEYIRARQVTVITNNGKSIFSKKREDVSVVLTGGELRFPKESMVGEFAINNLNRVTASKSFLGVSGITAQEGVTTSVLQEAAINDLMLTRVIGPRVIVADHTKIGRTNHFISGSIECVSLLITDTQADESQLAPIRDKGVQIIQVEPLQTLPAV